MAEETSKILHKEKASLHKLRYLLTKFRGDEPWAPLGGFEALNDHALFAPSIGDIESMNHAPPIQNGVQHDGGPGSSSSGRTGENGGLMANGVKGAANGISASQAPRVLEVPAMVENVVMSDGRKDAVAADENREVVQLRPVEEAQVGANLEEGSAPSKANEGVAILQKRLDGDAAKPAKPDSGADKQDGPLLPTDQDLDMKEASDRPETNGNSKEEFDQTSFRNSASNSDNDDRPPPPRRMTTRARAQAASTSTTTTTTQRTSRSPSLTPTQVHPFFLLPSISHPDRDFGLPSAEAEETRRLLLSFVQKQEEVVRGTERIYHGLLRADRMRREVLEWCTAEGHLGEMSDSEDWYDMGYWGLEEELRKGAEEEGEEEDVVVGAGGGGGRGGRGKGGRGRK